MIAVILAGTLSLVLPEPPAAALRPRVIVYTARGCAPCKVALADLRKIADVCEEEDCPAWVTQVPTVVWEERALQGRRWVQFAPKHWRGNTWRGEWPRVKKMIEAAQ